MSINRPGASHHALLRRLFLLFVEHEVTALEPPLAEKSKFRVKKRAIAINKLEQAIRKVKDLLHNGKKYLALAKIARPGALLEIGSQNVGLWEREIKEAEVVAIHEYRSQLPGYVKSGRRYQWDFVVARLLVLGMVAYGWKYEEFTEGRTELTNQLPAYIDFLSLRMGEIWT
ncbi:hypothetical protein SLS56_011640 [Neofusicoccum ribis]|uniref:Uncharacterized protein n=1 Tax=Neofusicoccum ribis TaxID=45134 RepID=A0ABR3SB28_9PEZI